ncbi:MAG: hypothetical protein HY840_06390 [Bacteroidetes bacterium]|nr:hypothetical protein [Bacteroidota bacterium]
MTKQDFIQYLSHPENLNGKSIAMLEKLVQEYPYFQMGRMLYLKNLHNENSIDYEKNLHITSAYAQSGKVLYNLIKKRVVKEEVGTRLPIAIGMAVGNENRELTLNTILQASNEILPKLEPIAILQEMPINIKDAKQDVPDEIQVLEKQMLREAYRTSMTIDLLQQEEIKAPKSKLLQSINRSELNSFGDWMQSFSEKSSESTKAALSTSLQVTGIEKREIIDKFILEETAKSVPKPKTEFYSAEVMAKKSIQDDETFVTETLAKIYLKQGNLPKALRAYEILVVKHPEKIHIFAPLLEKIKKLLKDQKAK